MAKAAVNFIDIKPLVRDVSELKQEMHQVHNKVDTISDDLSVAKDDLAQLNRQFQEFMKDRIRAEALSQATTELVRVRQEIEKEFGEYGQVRKTMLGVLQATDLALVKKTTISNVSEELMISTPKYWLAPCLIAVAAWINNDRDLADRAIREALRRDEERTALTMALICRRNMRTDTCYEWLNIYFSHINAGNFTAGCYTFIDAYINGVFGPDTKHFCSDYVDKWLGQIKTGGPGFEEAQTECWKDFCVARTSSHDKVYRNLQAHVDNFDAIKNYTDRVYSSYDLVQEFKDIEDATVDLEQIKQDVDDNLVEVINNYAVEEVRLRDEEYCFAKVKESNGNIRYPEVKKALLAERARTQNEKLSLAEQMVKSILNKDEASLSEKKTAISFLKPYINHGYTKYLEETKPAFPESIQLTLNDYMVTIHKDSDADELKSAYKQYLHETKAQEVENRKQTKGKTNMYITIVCGVLALASIVLQPIFTPLLLGLTAFFGYKFYQTYVNPTKFLNKMDEKYGQLEAAGCDVIDACVAEWNTINEKVSEFETQGQKYLAS